MKLKEAGQLSSWSPHSLVPAAVIGYIVLTVAVAAVLDPTIPETLLLAALVWATVGLVKLSDRVE